MFGDEDDIFPKEIFPQSIFPSEIFVPEVFPRKLPEDKIKAIEKDSQK